MLMGRMLGPAQYGEMAAILSLLTIVAVGGGVVMTTTMYYSGEMYGRGNIAGIKKLAQIFSKFVFMMSIFFFLLGIILARPIANFFSIEHVVPVIIAFASFIFGFVILVNKGILQGTQRFVAFSLIGILEMVLRVFLAVIFVKIGLALSGAIAAAVIATALAYLATYWPLSKLWHNIKAEDTTDFHFDRHEVTAYTTPVLITTLLLAIILNLDVILVKHYFPTDQAGLYAAVSTVGKIILYLTAPIISVMFPMILEKKSRGQKHFKMLLFSLGLTVIGAVLVLAVYSAAPTAVVRILYGSGFIELSYLLPQLGIFILFYTLINLLANYFLAVKNFIFIYFMSAGLVLVLIWTALSHTSIAGMIRIFTISDALILMAMISYYLYDKRKQLTQYFKGKYE